MLEQRDINLINSLEHVATQVHLLIDRKLYQEAEALYNEWREHFIESDKPIVIESTPYWKAL